MALVSWDELEIMQLEKPETNFVELKNKDNEVAICLDDIPNNNYSSNELLNVMTVVGNAISIASLVVTSVIYIQ